jgi:DNA-binding SARP family transcriptional activator
MQQQQPWSVNLLGVPSASRGGGGARLRSKETWAVLASLLLPESLNGGHRHFPHPPPCSRGTLALRFWGDSRNSPRACLRQSLASLRTAFDADCFLSVGERQDVQVRPNCFVTDIERMLASYHAALLAPSPEERVRHLTEAEGEIRGELLEGCVEPGDAGEMWLLNRRADVRTKIVLVLTALLDALTEQGNRNAALDVARRALQFHPADTDLRRRAWELAVATGQEDALREIEGAEGLGDAVARLRHRNADTLTPREGRLFGSLFLAQVSQLPADLREPFGRLSVLPGPFTARQARVICHVPKAALEALARTPLVDREEGDGSASGGRYFLPGVVRDAALRELPAATRNRLSGRLAAYCHDYVSGVMAAQSEKPPPPFETAERAEPFFRAALEWHFTRMKRHQEATITKLIEIVGRLPLLGLSGLAREAVPHLRRASLDEAIPLPLRHYMVRVAGNTLFLSYDHGGVIEFLTRAIAMENALADSFPPEERMLCHAALAIAHHYAGDSPAALTYLREAQAHHEQTGRVVLVAESLRVQAEILNHLGEYEGALRACERALVLRRAICEDTSAAVVARHEVADALFWEGSTLFRLGRFGESTDSIREALSIWQETENATGIGHCLRLLGRLRAEEGVFGEAKAHLHHSILIHEGTGSAGCRIAAVEALADVLLREGKHAKAKPLYGECLAHHAAQQPPHPDKVERFTQQVARCDEAVTASASAVTPL